jgi:hypothetical protein
MLTPPGSSSAGSPALTARAPESLTIDIDATLITSHSEKECAAGNYKRGYGFHPLHACCDETREALGVIRPANRQPRTLVTPADLRPPAAIVAARTMPNPLDISAETPSSQPHT